MQIQQLCAIAAQRAQSRPPLVAILKNVCTHDYT